MDDGQFPDRKEFRRQLDDVLRRRDPSALRAFLIGAGQWADETTTDPECAMWMMIAASPALASLHGEAERWLRAHGRAAEAQAILGRGKPAGPPRGARPPGTRPRTPNRRPKG